MRSILLLAVFVTTTIGTGTFNFCPITYSIEDRQQEKCLATMVYGEARGESSKGQIAVAWTAINRAKDKSLCDVVLKPKQYSIFNNNPELRAVALSMNIEPQQQNSIDSDSWALVKHNVQLVLRYKIADPTQGATHYIADKVMRAKRYHYPKWSKQYRVVAVIDNHRFFKKD